MSIVYFIVECDVKSVFIVHQMYENSWLNWTLIYIYTLLGLFINKSIRYVYWFYSAIVFFSVKVWEFVETMSIIKYLKILNK